MQQLNKPTYSEQVVNLIRQRIRNGKLRSGDRISEASIAEECGISRAPVREALYQLETEGFLMSHPKRGKCVTLLTGDGIRHRYELCGLLEGAAAANVVLSLPKGPWEELEALLDRMKQGVLSGTSFEDHAALGTAFHETILERASNPLLIAIARSSCRVISKYLMFQQWRTLYTTEELFQRHNSMYEAFLTRNPSKKPCGRIMPIPPNGWPKSAKRNKNPRQPAPSAAPISPLNKSPAPCGAFCL